MHKSILLLIFSLIISACTMTPTDDIQVTTEMDSRVNFSAYKSYDWLGSIGVFNDPEGKWKPVGFDMDSEVTFLINRELRKQGIVETSTAPDLLVMYQGGVDMAALEEKLDPATQMKILQNVPQGGLVIALIDARTGFAVWVATASAEIRNLPSEQVRNRLDYAVTRMLKQLPK